MVSDGVQKVSGADMECFSLIGFPRLCHRETRQKKKRNKLQ